MSDRPAPPPRPPVSRAPDLVQFRLLRLLKLRHVRRRVAADPGREPDVLPGAVLFDMDGLLVDSEPLWTLAEAEVARELGGVFTPATKAAIVGKRMDVAVPILLASLGTPQADAADAAAVADRLLDLVATLYAEGTPLLPGALDLLAALEAASVPMALVSSSFRRLVDAALPALGPSRFAATVAGDEVEHGKPHPEPYLTAAERLGVPPERCVVLEDAPSGVRSALAAGCACVMVPNVEHVEAPPGVEVRGSLTEVDPPLLGRLVPAAG